MDCLHCPFCGSRATHLRQSFVGVYASCDECGAEGPIRGSLASAAEGWNTRVFGAVENPSIPNIAALDAPHDVAGAPG